MGTTLVIFDGGEPALYQELPELVASVDDRAISTLFTSGAGFTAALARRLKEAGLYAVNVSLDSPIEAEHDAMRGREGVFSEAMRPLKMPLLPACWWTSTWSCAGRTCLICRGFHELARRMGVHELTFFEVVCTGRWSERQNIALLPADHALSGRLCQKRRRAPPRIFSVPEAYQRFGCFAATSWMHITPAGEVYPCSCYPESWGSIFEEPIKKIWRRMGAFPYKKSKVCPMRK